MIRAAAIGQRVETADGSFRVVGVMPPGFRFPTAIEKIWRPLVPPPQDRDRSKQIVAVLADAARASTVSAMVASLVNADRKPGDSLGPITAVPMPSAHKDPRALTNSGAFTSFDAPRLFMMLIGLVICLAAIVWLNVAGLSLASSIERVRVRSVQTALGASRATLVRTAILESAIPTVAGAAGGLVLAITGASALAAALPPALSSILANPIDVDLRAFISMAVVTGVGVILTSLPAVWWTSRPFLVDCLRRASASVTMSPRQMTARYALMAGQMALTVLLIAIAGLLVQSYLARLDEDKGFDSASLATIEIRQPRGSSQAAADLDRAILSRLRASSAVGSVARTNRLPPGLRGGSTSQLWISGSASPAGEVANTYFDVDPEYFRTMGIRLLAGRFTAANDSPTQVVVDAEFARRFWPNGDAVGARYSTGRPKPSGPTYEIVGITSRVQLDTTQVPQGGDVYIFHRTLSPDSTALTYVVRPSAPERLPDITTLVRSLADDSQVRVRRMDDRYAEVYGDTRIAATLTGAFALMALPVVMVGLYGITAVLVASRTREIGIRLALGAKRDDIRKLVLGPAFRYLTAGVVLGTIAALASTRAIESQIAGVSAADPFIYIGTVAAMVLSATLATWHPARRAARVDPMVTLKSE